MRIRQIPRHRPQMPKQRRQPRDRVIQRRPPPRQHIPVTREIPLDSRPGLGVEGVLMSSSWTGTFVRDAGIVPPSAYTRRRPRINLEILQPEHRPRQNRHPRIHRNRPPILPTSSTSTAPPPFRCPPHRLHLRHQPDPVPPLAHIIADDQIGAIGHIHLELPRRDERQTRIRAMAKNTATRATTSVTAPISTGLAKADCCSRRPLTVRPTPERGRRLPAGQGPEVERRFFVPALLRPRARPRGPLPVPGLGSQHSEPEGSVAVAPLVRSPVGGLGAAQIAAPLGEHPEYAAAVPSPASSPRAYASWAPSMSPRRARRFPSSRSRRSGAVGR